MIVDFPSEKRIITKGSGQNDHITFKGFISSRIIAVNNEDYYQKNYIKVAKCTTV